ncbi:MAG: ATP-binding protein [Lachnospiraceae bacterium]|nr:ATP-binding protein [Lachnospiraceae bacterium]
MKKDSKNKEVKKLFQGRIIIVVVISIIVIFSIVVGVALNIIGSYLVDEADRRYQLVTDNVQEEITTWFSNEAQIVLNQKAALEINNEFDPDELTEYLTTIVEDYNDEGYIYDLYFVNTDNVMSSGYGYIPDPSIDFRERPWYKDALDKDGLFYSSPYKDTNLDRYVVTISTTCYNRDGTLSGILALDIFVDTLFSIAEDKVIDGNSYVFLVDNNLGIATHPNTKFGYVDEEPIHISSVENNIYNYVVNYINGNSEILTDKSHFNIKDYDGVNRAIYVSNISCCGWYVVTAIESSVFYERLYRTLFFVILALLGCLVAGIILTRFFTQSYINQLNEANENATIANEAKGIFLANMSHEIRTPINAIIGMNEMILRENSDPIVNDFALDIASASRSLVTIVNDILDFSKIESGKMDLVETEFNIASMINDIVNMSESRLGNKELALFFEVDPEIPVGILGDEMRIKQIIINMMTNAIKYTNTGFVVMKVGFTKQEYGINLNVLVKDTGIGISEENIEQLYESFKRFDAKRNRSIEGTGLGLSISKRLVQNMGGFINVSSTIGVGSEFSICIPLKVVNSSPFISLENPIEIRMATLFNLDAMDIRMRNETSVILDEIKNGLKFDLTNSNNIEELKTIIKDKDISHILIDKKIYFEYEEYFKDLSLKKNVIVLQKRGNAIDLPESIINFYTPLYSISMVALLNNKKSTFNQNGNIMTFEAPDYRVLIVDDNAMNLKVAAGLLKPYKIKVTTVDSGQKAIDLLEADPTYDLVFMDHMMPIMDGVEATLRIRQLSGEYYKNIKIIALTANTINSARNMFLANGFNEFLAKPININSLDKLLRAYIPEDKMKEKNDSGVNTDNVTEESKEDDLKFSVNTGLKYSGGSEDLYYDILKEYVENSNEMKDLIKTYFDNEDWPNYVIKVHALKSMSLTIGAVNLSNLAKELELSGKAQNYEPILNKTEKLLIDYEEILRLSRELLSKKGIEVLEADNSKVENDLFENLDKDIITKYANRFKEALDEFDTDLAEEIYNELDKAHEGYEILFKNVVELIKFFEYDKAREEIERILSK